MLSTLRSKELSPGDALSCFKGPIREGTPDEQLAVLKVLIQFVDADPHLANLLHTELATRRWRERFVVLAASPNPEVRPLLVATLQGWSASYRAHDIGMHYQTTLRELNGPGGTLPAYNPQYTGYSMQATGYSTQATGSAYGRPPPPPGFPGGPPPPPPPTGYPAYGSMTAPYPPPPPPMQHAPSHRQNDGATVATKLDQLTAEVETLRGAIRSFETALADYKAQRCAFSALSTAMERGQRSADKCTSLQSQLENLLGTSDGGDEALMGRIFSTNDTVVAVVDQWKRLANQELAPDDTPAMAAAGAAAAGAAASTSAGGGAAAGASTSAAGAGPSAAAAPPPPPARPPPSPLDLLLGDELPPPVPAPGVATTSAAPPPPPPPPPPPSMPPTANGSVAWGAPPAAPAPAPAPDAAAAAAAAAGGAFFGTGVAAAGMAAAGPSMMAAGSAGAAQPVVPASDPEGLRTQVLALSAELERQRKMHQTALETQEAFHRSEMAQVKAQFQARITELEAALARQQLQPHLSAGSASNQMAPFSSITSAPSASTAAAAQPPPPLFVPQIPGSYAGSLASPPSAPPPPPPPQPSSTLPSTNPFASFAPPPPPSSFAPPPPPSSFAPPQPPSSYGSVAAPGSVGLFSPSAAAPPPPPPLASVPSVSASASVTSPYPQPPAPAPTSSGPALDPFSAFDDLALGAKKSAGGAPAVTAVAAAPTASAAMTGPSWVNFGQ